MQQTAELVKGMREAAAEGHFNVSNLGLVANENSIGGAVLEAECPGGTVVRESVDFTQKFSCGA